MLWCSSSLQRFRRLQSMGLDAQNEDKLIVSALTATFTLTSHHLHSHLPPPSLSHPTTFTLTSHHLHSHLPPPSLSPPTTFTFTFHHLHSHPTTFTFTSCYCLSGLPQLLVLTLPCLLSSSPPIPLSPSTGAAACYHECEGWTLVVS